MSALGRSKLIVVLVGAVATSLGFVDAAQAGTYVIRNCNVPGDARRPIGPWAWDKTAAAGTFGVDDCATGGGFGIDAGTMAWGLSTGVAFETPPAISIRQMRLWLVARLRSTEASALFAVVTSGNATMSNPVGLFNDPGGSTLTSPYVSPALAPDTHVYLVLINCSGGTGMPCQPMDTNVLEVRGAEATLEENTPPAGSISGGDILAPGPVSGLRSLSYTASDAESGIAKVEITAGKTTVGGADFAADCAYAGLAACPPARNSTLAVDTRKVPDGIYPVSLAVTDAAGNVRTIQSPTAIQVANGIAAPQTVGSSDSTTSARLTAAFAANRRSILTIGYGRRPVIRGRLIASSGAPLGGAAVRLTETSEVGNLDRQGRKVVTNPDGTFSFRPAKGPTRTITFSFGTDSAVAARLRLRVEASANLRVALKGTLVRYRGRVLSTPLPRGGKRVEIQGRAPGSGWKTFAQLRTNRSGTFSGTYRLRVHRPGVHLRFRVRLPSESSYPFVAHSGGALVRVVR